MKITEQEQQMLELLREWSKSANYQLQIEIVDGLWDIVMKELGARRAACGTGESGQRRILARDGLSAFDPKRTSAGRYINLPQLGMERHGKCRDLTQP